MFSNVHFDFDRGDLKHTCQKTKYSCSKDLLVNFGRTAASRLPRTVLGNMYLIVPMLKVYTESTTRSRHMVAIIIVALQSSGTIC